MSTRRSRMRERREQLEATLATGQGPAGAGQVAEHGRGHDGRGRPPRAPRRGRDPGPGPWLALIAGVLATLVAAAAAELNATLWERRRPAG